MLQAWAASKGAEPGQITGSVRADDQKVTVAD